MCVEGAARKEKRVSIFFFKFLGLSLVLPRWGCRRSKGGRKALPIVPLHFATLRKR